MVNDMWKWGETERLRYSLVLYENIRIISNKDFYIKYKKQPCLLLIEYGLPPYKTKR